MKNAAGVGLFALGEGFKTEFRSAGTLELRRTTSVFTKATDGTTMLSVADDAEVVEAEADGCSRFG